MTILATYGCTAACENCCFGSHPGITERIPRDRLLSYVDQAAELGGISLLVFSGGECFTLGQDLDDAIARATSLGLATRCVTNGYWAGTAERALARLEPLAAAGLCELNVSTGDMHQEFVGTHHVVHAAAAGTALGMRTVVVVESRAGREFTAERLNSNPDWQALASDPERSGLLTVIESPWMSMDEQATVEQPAARLVSRHTLHTRGGCDSVLNTLVVNPSEELGACCGLTREQIPEMRLGSLRERSLRDLFEEGVRDFLKIWIYVEGPERILAWAATKDPAIEWEYRFSHHCDACRSLYHDERVREAIRAHHAERVPDVLLRFNLMNSFGLDPRGGERDSPPTQLREGSIHV